MNPQLHPTAKEIHLNRKESLWIIISICTAGFMSRMDVYSVSISLPTISRYFNVNTGTVSMVALAYFLCLTSSLLIFGKIEDEAGFKRVFLRGYFIYIVGAILCGISPYIYLLVFFRCVQGVGVAMIISSAYAIIPGRLPSNKQGSVFGYLAMAGGLGVAAGATFGGIISGLLSWRGLFFFNAGVGVFGLLAARTALSKKNPPHIKNLYAQFDIPGAIIFFFFILTLLAAINRLRELGWGSPVVISCWAGSVILFGAFILREKKIRDPLLDIRIFKNIRFSLSIVVGILVYMFIAGNAFILPFYLERSEGLKPQHVGLLFLLYALLVAAISPRAGKATDRYNPRSLVTIALFLGTGACIIFSFILSSNGLLPVVSFLLLLGLAIGLFLSPNNCIIMSSSTSQGRGIISGVYNTGLNLGMALGVCIFEAIFSFRVLQGEVSPSGVKIPLNDLAGGYRNIYQFAGFLFLVALGISVILLVKRKKV